MVCLPQILFGSFLNTLDDVDKIKCIEHTSPNMMNLDMRYFLKELQNCVAYSNTRISYYFVLQATRIFS